MRVSLPKIHLCLFSLEAFFEMMHCCFLFVFFNAARVYGEEDVILLNSFDFLPLELYLLLLITSNAESQSG